MNPSSTGREAANRSTISFCRNHSAAHHLLLLCFYHNRASKPAPCSFSSLYSSRHQQQHVEDNDGRAWTMTIPTSHSIKCISNLQRIKNHDDGTGGESLDDAGAAVAEVPEDVLASSGVRTFGKMGAEPDSSIVAEARLGFRRKRPQRWR